jgi:hypothetical protein
LQALRHAWNTGDLRISSRGQMSLPAAARHRWQLAEGGEVGYLDRQPNLLSIEALDAEVFLSAEPPGLGAALTVEGCPWRHLI